MDLGQNRGGMSESTEGEQFPEPWKKNHLKT